jgi:hypothetical protein
MNEGKKCNIASAVGAHCIKTMLQIVSMSRYTDTIQHSTSPNLTQNWATSIIHSFHPFSSLSHDRSKASSKASSPHSAI